MSTSSVRRSLPALSGAVLVALLAAACSTAATAAPPTTAPAASTAAGGTGVVVSMSGSVLTGPNGLTLYTHAGDSATSSTCTGGCASSWPPLTTPAGTTPTAATGVTGTLATLTRADGSVQVTYNGLPLYGWQGDSKAGDTTGDGVNGFAVAKP